MPGVDFHLGLVTGYYGNQLRMIWDEPPDPLSNYDYEQLYQAQRPDIFVRKLASRRWFERSRPTVASHSLASTFITEKEFAEIYAAAVFAAYHDLTCETAVTLWWDALGAPDAVSAEALFTSFLKDMNEWLYEYDIPTAYFYSHESSPRVGLHTHLAVHLGLGHYPSATRDEFRKWAMKWPERNKLGRRPRAIRVTGPQTRSLLLHWYRFHYQMKGYDPHAVVRPALVSHSRTDTKLGDLIACRWQDPGVVEMTSRVGRAVNLGPGRRKIGIPEGLEVTRKKARAMKKERRVAVPFSFGDPSTRFRPPEPARPSFVSPYEAGHRSVHDLYHLEINTRVTKLSYQPEPPRQPPRPDEFMLKMELI
ncbi:hypothetical protein [Methylorubrum thiocyanatum]